MRTALLTACALACGLVAGHACAQEGARVCKSFCEADAKQCRKDAQEQAAIESNQTFDWHDPSPPKDDFSSEKRQAELHAAEAGRFNRTQKCVATRMACVQRCGSQAETSDRAASAPAPAGSR